MGTVIHVCVGLEVVLPPQCLPSAWPPPPSPVPGQVCPRPLAWDKDCWVQSSLRPQPQRPTTHWALTTVPCHPSTTCVLGLFFASLHFPTFSQ